MRTYLENEFSYNELSELNFDEGYLDMLDYTLKCYDDKSIVENHGEISVVSKDADLSMIDLDAIRWKLGLISTAELKQLYNEFYMRRG